jgi:2-phosphosulfolactate phosphatase
VLPAGEKCSDASLRPAFEDLIGAGAILRHLTGSLSPEAAIASNSFPSIQADILTNLRKCSSGKELIAKGFESDIQLAMTYHVSSCVPLFTNNADIKSV